MLIRVHYIAMPEQSTKAAISVQHHCHYHPHLLLFRITPPSMYTSQSNIHSEYRAVPPDSSVRDAPAMYF